MGMGEGRDLWDEAAEKAQAAGAGPAVPARPAVAVALQYDPSLDDAPVVTASGKGALAEQILQLAFANGVKVRTDPDLAQVLAAVEVDTVIPLEAFAAVAEILAYVYRANGTMPQVIADGAAALALGQGAGEQNAGGAA